MKLLENPIFPKISPWALLCWGAGLILGVGWIVPLFLHPDPSLLLPSKHPDSLLYTLFIQKASAGFYLGDPCLWEHWHDPESVFSFYHFWLRAYGSAYGIGGYPLLLFISLFLSGLWFYQVFCICLRLGQPRPYAFFTAGVQAFFVVNLAYQAVAYKTNFTAYSFWSTEHTRLYPSVTSMAFYNAAALGVLWTLERPTLPRTGLAAFLIALTAYGRPFDWMVLLGALLLFSLVGYARRDRVGIRTAIIILTLAILFSMKFILDCLQYQELHRNAFFDQLIRGSLRVMSPSHYLKYFVLCGILLTALAVAYGKTILRRDVSRDSQTATLVWVCSLATSGLLLHFKTAFEGGVTFVGFSYLMVFSIAPWFFMLAAHCFWSRLSSVHTGFFRSRLWVVLLFSLLVIQQLGIGLDRVPTESELAAERDHRDVYHWIKASGTANPVVMTLGNGLEAGAFADAWIFFINPGVSAYTSSAPTTELLERLLLSKLLLTGTLQDLAPLFPTTGLSNYKEWSMSRNPQTRFWLERFEGSIGHNTYVFHPFKCRGELAFRGIQLSGELQLRNEEAAYFTKDLRVVFQRLTSENTSPAFDRVLEIILGKFRLNFIHVPSEAIPCIDLKRLRDSKCLEEIRFPTPVNGKLWRIIDPIESHRDIQSP